MGESGVEEQLMGCRTTALRRLQQPQRASGVWRLVCRMGRPSRRMD